MNEFVDTLMSEGRFALLLRPQIAVNLSPESLAHGAAAARTANDAHP